MASSFRTVVIGASAGGVEGLKALVAGLPADFPAAVFVVLHTNPDAVSHLPSILQRSGALTASHPADGEEIRPGHIYIARPDHHLLVEGATVGVKKGPKENRFRPSVDALFRSAAYSHRARTVGVVLSGMLDDGTSGLWTIKRFGGLTIVQDPAETPFDSMPLSAISQVDIDHCLSAEAIGTFLDRIVRAGAIDGPDVPRDLEALTSIEVKVAAKTNAFREGIMDYGVLSPFTCPECHGALVRIDEGPLTRFRCHTGHGFTANALLAGITDFVEPALWNVTRALEECVMLLDDLAQEAAAAGRDDDSRRFSHKARETEQRAGVLQKLTVEHEHLSHDTLVGTPMERDG